MQERLQFYIDGRWVDPIEARPFDVIDPATEEPIARIALGSAKDIDVAVSAARKAFETFSETTPKERLELLEAIAAVYQTRASTISPRRFRVKWARPSGSRRLPKRRRDWAISRR